MTALALLYAQMRKTHPFRLCQMRLNLYAENILRIASIAPARTCFSCLKSAPPSYISDLKNVYIDGMEEILIGDAELYARIHSYFKMEMPERTDLLRLYDDADFPLGKLYSTQTALEKALREKAWLKNGGYLVIQPTEALTVIDVNSGKSIAGKGRK